MLNKNGVFQSDDDFKCKHCNTFAGKNKASLGAHIRNCKFNPINIQPPMVLELEIKNDIQPIMESANNTVINTQQISKKKSSKNK